MIWLIAIAYWSPTAAGLVALGMILRAEGLA